MLTETELRDFRRELWNLLMDGGFSRDEAHQLLAEHAPDCTCWPCLIALHKAVRSRLPK
jgi:hypothetical protein